MEPGAGSTANMWDFIQRSYLLRISPVYAQVQVYDSTTNPPKNIVENVFDKLSHLSCSGRIVSLQP